ncbi:MAG: CoA-binding protein [Deltaproteobacteria bacterium]|nr:CoA-binding protein [Deltaproteobacteria bacterium]
MNGWNDLHKKLDRMFFPKSVAVVGASDLPGKWGNLILISILGWKFTGKVFPVNPNKETVFDLKSYPSLLDIPEEVDLAVFAIPARLIPDGFRDCVKKGIHAAVVISSGFKETGDIGKALEEEIIDIARNGNMVFIGPNTMGIASAHHDFEAIPTPTPVEAGGLAIISQSGNLGLQILKWVAHKNIGLNIYAGTGNEAMLNASDMMRYLGERDDVKAIAMYIEGISNGREFMEIAEQVTSKKPVIALKTGRSRTGSKAAQSHTGSMAGSYATYEAMFAQKGITRVKTPTDLLNVSAAMTHLPMPKSNRVGIMTMGGGWGIVAADECEDAGLFLPELSGDIISRLDSLLPDYWNRGNPVDLVGEGDADMYLQVIEVLARWDEIDSVIPLGIVGRSQYMEDFITCQERMDGKLYTRELKLSVLKNQLQNENRIISGIARLQKETRKPIVLVALSETGLSLSDTEHGKVMSLSSPEQAVSIISHMAQYGMYLKQRTT